MEHNVIANYRNELIGQAVFMILQKNFRLNATSLIESLRAMAITERDESRKKQVESLTDELISQNVAFLRK